MKTYLSILLAASTGALITGAVMLGVVQPQSKPTMVPSAPETEATSKVTVPTSAISDSSEHRLDKLENAMVLIAEQMIELKQDITAIAEQGQESVVENPSAVTVKKPELSREQKQALKEAQLQELEYLATNRENADAAWSVPMEQTISDRIATTAELKVATQSSAQCGDNVCKITATLPTNLSATDKDIFAWRLLMSLGQELPTATGSTVTQQDGSTLMTYYLSRAGHSLPSAGQ